MIAIKCDRKAKLAKSWGNNLLIVIQNYCRLELARFQESRGLAMNWAAPAQDLGVLRANRTPSPKIHCTMCVFACRAPYGKSTVKRNGPKSNQRARPTCESRFRRLFAAQGLLNKFDDELAVRQLGRVQAPREAAVLADLRVRIHFEDEELARRVHAEIDAGIVAATEKAIR